MSSWILSWKMTIFSKMTSFYSLFWPIFQKKSFITFINYISNNWNLASKWKNIVWIIFIFGFDINKISSWNAFFSSSDQLFMRINVRYYHEITLFYQWGNLIQKHLRVFPSSYSPQNSAKKGNYLLKNHSWPKRWSSGKRTRTETLIRI